MAWPFDSSVDPNNWFGLGGAVNDVGRSRQLDLNAALTGSGITPNVNSSEASTGSLFSSLSDLFSRDSLFGGTDRKTGVATMGWAPAALGIGQSIFGALQGRQAMNLARDQLNEGRRQFDLNYNAQRTSMNTELEDRQRARVASNPTAYESVDTYMNKNRIK